MAQVSVTGYTDKPSVVEGETVSFYVTADNATQAQVDIVRLIHGDENPEGPGFIEELVLSDFSGIKPVKKQFVDLGNAIRVPDPSGKLELTDSLTIATYVYATTPEKGRQVLLGKFSLNETAGYALGIDHAGRLAFWIANGSDTDEIVSQVPMAHHTWYFVAASFDAKSGKAILHQEAIVNPYNGRLGRVAPFDHLSSVEQSLKLKIKNSTTDFMWAAAGNSATVRGAFKDLLFNGKIDRSYVWNRALSLTEVKSQ